MEKHIKEIDENTFDYKTKLQEYVQADSRKAIVYELLDSKDYEYCKKEWLNLFEKCKNLENIDFSKLNIAFS